MKSREVPLIAYPALGWIRAPRGAMNEEIFLDEAITSDLLSKVRNGILNDAVRDLLKLIAPGWESGGETLGLAIAERELAQLWSECWLKCQREAADKGFLTKEMLRYLDGRVPGWRKP